MKVVKFILKLIGTLLGVITTVYIVGMYISLTLQSSINKKNVEKLVSNIDLISDSSKIFTDNDRIVERTINDIKVGNLTYEDKKEILYDSKLYSSVEEYLTGYVYYFIGYEDSKYIISEEDKLLAKQDIKKVIQSKTNATNEELEEVEKQIDKLYTNLEEIELSSLVKELPEEYKTIVDYINSNGLLIAEIVLLVILLFAIGLLTRSYAEPFKWLTIGLFLSTILSFGLKFALSNFEKIAETLLPLNKDTLDVANIFITKIKDVMLGTVNTSVIITFVSLLISLVITVLLVIQSKNKAEDALGKTQINIEKINI